MVSQLSQHYLLTNQVFPPQMILNSQMYLHSFLDFLICSIDYFIPVSVSYSFNYFVMFLLLFSFRFFSIISCIQSSASKFFKLFFSHFTKSVLQLESEWIHRLEIIDIITVMSLSIKESYVFLILTSSVEVYIFLCFLRVCP